MTYFENMQESKESASLGPVPANYPKRIGATVVDILVTALAWTPAIIFLVIGVVEGIKEVDLVTEETIRALTDGEEGEIFWGVAAGSWGVAAILGTLALIWSIWYFGYRQGKTGLTPGKRIAGTKLINIETGTPPGGAKGVGRSIIPSVLGSFSSGIYQLIDYLWPLWDEKNQRLTDKIFSTQVVLDQKRQESQDASVGSQTFSGTDGGSDPSADLDQGPSGDTPIFS
ncbi:RDD family protein [Acidimicrobiaceae bacterium]|nr:RDD family protein [Acidimicrobiaceae bacterium]